MLENHIRGAIKDIWRFFGSSPARMNYERPKHAHFTGTRRGGWFGGKFGGGTRILPSDHQKDMVASHMVQLGPNVVFVVFLFLRAVYPA